MAASCIYLPTCPSYPIRAVQFMKNPLKFGESAISWNMTRQKKQKD